MAAGLPGKLLGRASWQPQGHCASDRDDSHGNKNQSINLAIIINPSYYYASASATCIWDQSSCLGSLGVGSTNNSGLWLWLPLGESAPAPLLRPRLRAGVQPSQSWIVLRAGCCTRALR